MKPITERQFQQQVLHLAKLYGWLTYHTWSSVHSAAGFPDLVMVRPPRLIFAELKTEKGKPTNAQLDWQRQFRQCDQVEAYIWRPSDWETILEVLQ